MERLKRLQTEREVLEILASESHSETELLSEGSLYRDLLIQCMEKEFEEDDEIARWKEESFETSLRYADHLKISTLSGIKVRSKSESIIANELYAHGIPFRYECALELDQKVYFPDFTILRPYDKQIVYWEHFGLIGDMEYRKNMLSKLETYIENGIVPDINLIMSFETGDDPLDILTVRKKIESYLV